MMSNATKVLFGMVLALGGLFLLPSDAEAGSGCFDRRAIAVAVGSGCFDRSAVAVAVDPFAFRTVGFVPRGIGFRSVGVSVGTAPRRATFVNVNVRRGLFGFRRSNVNVAVFR